jgi:hypothetical protein
MSQYLKAKAYSAVSSANVRVVLTLVVLAALALAAGAPHDWGGGG